MRYHVGCNPVSRVDLTETGKHSDGEFVPVCVGVKECGC